MLLEQLLSKQKIEVFTMIEALTEKLLVDISCEPFFKIHKAILIGGTALAINLNHRVSQIIK